jgi:ferrochelatase
MTKFTGNPDFRHDSQPRLGVLLTNFGSPDAPDAVSVRKFLAEFLSDPRVIEVPRPVWWLVLHGFILRVRPRRSAESYSKIWTNEGSPLLAVSKKLAAAVESELNRRFPGPMHVELAMRYGKPSIRSGLEKLRSANVQRLLVLPLFPQFSATTTASTFDAVADVLKSWRWLPELRMITHYHDDAGYIHALSDGIRQHWQQSGQAEKLLFSFHGIPKDYFAAGDPYHCECHQTARLVAEKLELSENHWQVCFQSRFGPRTWLKPYTDQTLKDLAKKGIHSVDVICPGFAADCLETLEEINLRYRTLFMASGGKQFNYIPALNDHPLHIHILVDLIMKHTQGWPESSTDWDSEKAGHEAKLRAERARKMESK